MKVEFDKLRIYAQPGCEPGPRQATVARTNVTVTGAIHSIGAHVQRRAFAKCAATWVTVKLAVALAAAMNPPASACRSSPNSPHTSSGR